MPKTEIFRDEIKGTHNKKKNSYQINSNKFQNFASLVFSNIADIKSGGVGKAIDNMSKKGSPKMPK